MSVFDEARADATQRPRDSKFEEAFEAVFGYRPAFESVAGGYLVDGVVFNVQNDLLVVRTQAGPERLTRPADLLEHEDVVLRTEDVINSQTEPSEPSSE